MRREFHPILHRLMEADNKIVVCTADLGFGMFDQIARDFPTRFFNFGADEQLMVGAAVGLSKCGFIPICYSITSFLIKRPFEWIDNYMEHEGANVKLIGGGRDKEYSHDGYSHYGCNDQIWMNCFPRLFCYWPDTIKEMEDDLVEMIYNGKPSYLNLKR
jgi:transketolase